MPSEPHPPVRPPPDRRHEQHGPRARDDEAERKDAQGRAGKHKGRRGGEGVLNIRRNGGGGPGAGSVGEVPVHEVGGVGGCEVDGHRDGGHGGLGGELDGWDDEGLELGAFDKWWVLVW